MAPSASGVLAVRRGGTPRGAGTRPPTGRWRGKFHRRAVAAREQLDGLGLDVGDMLIAGAPRARAFPWRSRHRRSTSTTSYASLRRVAGQSPQRQERATGSVAASASTPMSSSAVWAQRQRRPPRPKVAVVRRVGPPLTPRCHGHRGVRRPRAAPQSRRARSKGEAPEPPGEERTCGDERVVAEDGQPAGSRRG